MSGIEGDFLRLINKLLNNTTPDSGRTEEMDAPEDFELFCWPSAEEGVDVECDTVPPEEDARFLLVSEAAVLPDASGPGNALFTPRKTLQS